MGQPDIAVVTVNYRTASFTLDALRSIAAERATSGLRVRVIVVDNASGDLPVLEAVIGGSGWSSWVTLFGAPRNGGFAYGNNLGVERAYAAGAPDYVYFLNPDTQVRPGALCALVRFLETRPDVGIAGGSFEDLDGSHWPMAFRFPTLMSEIDSGIQFGLVTRLLRRWAVARRMDDTAQPVDWIAGAAMLVRPQVLATIGGLDENYFLYFEETDFCFRARQAGFATWYVPESRVMHVRGGSTGLKHQGAGSKRLPPYWFESRRRYFVLRFGIRQAILIDVVALTAHSLGALKRVVLGRRHQGIPYFMRDLVRYSVLWPRNRSIPPPRCRLAHVTTDPP